MKFLILVSLLSVSAFAQTPDESKPFDQRKQMMTEGLELRIAHLTAAKACVAAAKDGAGLTACHKEMKEKRQEMKGAMASKKEALKTQRQAIKANKAK